MRLLLQTLFLSLLATAIASADSKARGPKPSAGDSKKSLDFDGDVVEGMNRQPLDSLTSVSEGENGLYKNNLYKRKRKFKVENRELAREIIDAY